MFERFTDMTRKSIATANRETHRLGGNVIGDVEVLLGLMKVPESLAWRVLRATGLDFPAVLIQLEQMPRSSDDGATPEKRPQSPEFKRAIEAAIETAAQLGSRHVDTTHILLGLLSDPRNQSARILANHGVTVDSVWQAIKTLQLTGTANEA